MTTQKLQKLTVLLTCLFLLVACQPQSPILVFVTPTPAEVAVLPTKTAIVMATVTESATATQTATTTETPLPPTSVPTEAATTIPATFLGAVVAEGYVVPPTFTPRPLEIPTAQPTDAVAIPPTAEPPTAIPTLTPIPPSSQQRQMPDLNPNLMGIQLDSTLDQNGWNNALADMHRLGVKWVKVQVSWSQMQPNARGEVTVDFRRIEIYLETAFNQGFDVLVSVAKAPLWARSNQTEDGPPDNPQDLVDFVNLMLQEFGTSIDAIEVWNEPNLQREWQGQAMNGQTYMNYFVPVYQAVSAYSQRMLTDPNTPIAQPIKIITAGLAPTGESAYSRDDRTFLREMYRAGLAQYRDAIVGVHPYGWGNSPDATCCDSGPGGWDEYRQFFFGDTIADYHQIMLDNGHSSQLWVTEVGWATWQYLPGDPPQPWMSYVDECQQGNYLVRAFEIVEGRDYMGPMMIWNLNFATLAGMVEQRDERAAFSLMVPLEIKERAAYWMLYDAIHTDERLTSYARCPGPG